MSNYTDKMTLDEIKDNDLAMVEDAIKNAKRYSFGRNKFQALEFTRHCMNTTLASLGIRDSRPKGVAMNPVAETKFAEELDRKMREKDILIEQRRNYLGNDTWRNGMYIYQRGVLVAFISNVLAMGHTELSRDKLKIAKQTAGLFVITNAKTDQTQRIYTPPGTIFH